MNELYNNKLILVPLQLRSTPYTVVCARLQLATLWFLSQVAVDRAAPAPIMLMKRMKMTGSITQEYAKHAVQKVRCGATVELFFLFTD